MIYLDCETDGLTGQVWAICAVEKNELGQEIARFEARQADFMPTNEFVLENVWEHNKDLPESEDLHADFAEWWLTRKGAVCAHIPHPVETGLFRELQSRDLIGEWDHPFPFICAGSMLSVLGENPTEMDAALERRGIRPEGIAHDCRYDVAATMSLYENLMK